MRLAVIICVCAVSVLGSGLDHSWQEYKNTFGKVYNQDEEVSRRSAFESNLRTVEEHNREADAGRRSFRLALNKLADLTNEEYKRLLQLPSTRVHSSTRRDTTTSIDDNDISRTQGERAAPESLDWRDSGFVGPVRDQGQLGNAVLLATVDAVQSNERDFLRSLVSLSTQQLLECCGQDPCTTSCNYAGDCVQCLQRLGGVDSEDTYPSRQCQKCSFDAKDAVVPVHGYLHPAMGDEDNLKELVAMKGLPIVAIDASNLSFQLYSGGIYDEPNCSSTALDHAVNIVGYGSEDGTDYWIVRNSWGSSWGEAGYIRMSRNKNNQCGIASDVWFALSRP